MTNKTVTEYKPWSLTTEERGQWKDDDLMQQSITWRETKEKKCCINGGSQSQRIFHVSNKKLSQSDDNQVDANWRWFPLISSCVFLRDLIFYYIDSRQYFEWNTRKYKFGSLGWIFQTTTTDLSPSPDFLSTSSALWRRRRQGNDCFLFENGGP